MTLTVHIPTLETARLVLRPPEPADFPAFAAMMASERAAMMGGPFGTAGAWGAFCHAIGTWTYFGRGTLFITLKGNNTAIGEVGLNDGPLFPETELGWSLFSAEDEGHGYVTEAATTLRDWAFGTTDLGSLVSYTHPENHASQAVAKRLGAVRDHEAPRQDPEDVVFRHMRPQA